jgi:hypothetical protein
MVDELTEPVIAPRTVWLSVLAVAKRTDMSLADKIAGITVRHADFQTQPFLALRLKLIRNVQRAFEQETAEKLGSGEAEETEIEIGLTAAEAIYLDMSFEVAEFKGAMTLKKNLWRALTAILGRKEQ